MRSIRAPLGCLRELRTGGRLRRAAGAGLALGLALGFALACSGPPERPHIVLISIDTLGSANLGDAFVEAPELPVLEALAAESLRFENALSTASWTLPAQGSLLTGLYPDRHGGTDPRAALAQTAPRLAEQLRAHGYQTVAFTDSGYMRPVYGFHVGFDHYDDSVRSEALGAVALPRDGATDEPCGREPFDRAIAYLEARRPGDPPFFLFLQTFGVHDFFKVHPWAAARLPGFPDLTPDAYIDCLSGRSACPPPVFERLTHLYREELRHLDGELGRLLEAVRDTGIGSQTVLVFLSDHGEAFDTARWRMHHGGRLHADQLRVPFLLRAPWLKPRRIEAPISLVDVMPTLLEFAGAPRPAGLDGVSLLPLIDGGAAATERPLFAMEHYYLWQQRERVASGRIMEKPMMMAVVSDGYWLIHEPEGEELYALGDARQLHDLTREADQRERVEQLRRAIFGRVKARPSTPRVDLDGELLEELRSLGYVR